MNPEDDELNPDQKIKVPTRESKSDVEFLKAVTERSLGFAQKNNIFTAYNLQACAEDELIKKQFKEMRCEMPGLPRSTFLMVFSPDGSKVASTHGNHHIYVTDVRTGKHIKTLEGHPRTPWCIAFHPSSNQIIASGCLGGQVRIWDLSGGSEVWTADSQTVIASIAFHPDDRLLVIATCNELFFWDWSKPEPFMHVATGSLKEKVRYVAFDKLGHKLITGITNTPQTRWERVRAPVPVPRQADGSASYYRRRITPRLVTSLPIPSSPNSLMTTTRPITNNTMQLRDPVSSVPERERRITACYRNLVQEYEVLVHRYLQIYRPPVMVDRGTDPMEQDAPRSASTNTNNVAGPSTSGSQSSTAVPSTSGTQTLKKSSASRPAKNKSKKKVTTDNQTDSASNRASGSGLSVSRSSSNESTSTPNSELPLTTNNSQLPLIINNAQLPLPMNNSQLPLPLNQALRATVLQPTYLMDSSDSTGTSSGQSNDSNGSLNAVTGGIQQHSLVMRNVHTAPRFQYRLPTVPSRSDNDQPPISPTQPDIAWPRLLLSSEELDRMNRNSARAAGMLSRYMMSVQVPGNRDANGPIFRSNEPIRDRWPRTYRPLWLSTEDRQNVNDTEPANDQYTNPVPVPDTNLPPFSSGYRSRMITQIAMNEARRVVRHEAANRRNLPRNNDTPSVTVAGQTGSDDWLSNALDDLLRREDILRSTSILPTHYPRNRSNNFTTVQSRIVDTPRNSSAQIPAPCVSTSTTTECIPTPSELSNLRRTTRSTGSTQTGINEIEASLSSSPQKRNRATPSPAHVNTSYSYPTTSAQKDDVGLCSSDDENIIQEIMKKVAEKKQSNNEDVSSTSESTLSAAGATSSYHAYNETLNNLQVSRVAPNIQSNSQPETSTPFCEMRIYLHNSGTDAPPETTPNVPETNTPELIVTRIPEEQAPSWCDCVHPPSGSSETDLNRELAGLNVMRISTIDQPNESLDNTRGCSSDSRTNVTENPVIRPSANPSAETFTPDQSKPRTVYRFIARPTSTDGNAREERPTSNQNISQIVIQKAKGKPKSYWEMGNSSSETCIPTSNRNDNESQPILKMRIKCSTDGCKSNKVSETSAATTGTTHTSTRTSTTSSSTELPRARFFSNRSSSVSSSRLTTSRHHHPLSRRTGARRYGSDLNRERVNPTAPERSGNNWYDKLIFPTPSTRIQSGGPKQSEKQHIYKMRIKCSVQPSADNNNTDGRNNINFETPPTSPINTPTTTSVATTMSATELARSRFFSDRTALYTTPRSPNTFRQYPYPPVRQGGPRLDESRERGSKTAPERNSQEPQTTLPTIPPNRSSDTNLTENQAIYKMRIKCSVKPSTATDTVSSTPLNNPVTPELGASNTQTNTSNDNISDLIRNAELMLAKFRENLEQRGHLQGIDLPSTSRSLLSQNRLKPSKSTNTNDADAQNARKRLHPHGPRKINRRAILDSSSDSSSTDDEQSRPKRVKSGENEHAYAASSEINQNNSIIDLTSEHSYAGLTDGNDGNSESTVRIEINLPTNNPEEQRTLTTLENQPSTTRRSYHNFSTELELLVTDLLADTESNPTEQNVDTVNTPDTSMCNTCGGNMEERDLRNNNNSETPTTATNTSCARTELCVARSAINTSARITPTTTISTTTNSTTNTTTSELPRRRFFSHRLSAFYPTRLTASRNDPRCRRNCPRYLQPLLRSRLGNVTPSSPSPPASSNFAPDEVINYAERANEEEARSFHPFDPPPEFASINPENIGIGNMYSNIVQELESSLNDARNIRANRRLGETSDMLSSFSERLDSIMRQSSAILRNLSSSIDSLPPTTTSENAEQPADGAQSPRVVTSLRNIGFLAMRPESLYDLDADVGRSTYYNSPNNNPIASDHTYPINSSATNNMSPLMASLHLTVSHIQRQARLLRQQVESIERIDRAMLEVAQLQMMRQMFDEMHLHFGIITGSESNRVGVSSVRQMMAGTTISDTSPIYDVEEEEANTQTQNQETPEPQPSTSNTPQQERESQSRARARKTYPRCLFLMHRQHRRQANLGLGCRRNAAKDRTLRRNIYRRFLPSRTNNRPNIDISTNRGRGYLSLFNPDTLPSMTRRLEHFLMEHGRYIGRPMGTVPPTYGANPLDVGENIMTLRLNNCRVRMNRILGINDDSNRSDHASVTVDGTLRFGARQTLSSILETLSRYMDINANTNISSNFRTHIWEVIEFSLLLSDILLLQIVDSIPPPSGMNLDPERESLSARIDMMCSRMLQSRLIGQSYHLTRSLRLMRLTVRHATQALGQTYTARRNAMLPSTNNDNETADSRQGLLSDIHNCLGNIRRHGPMRAGPSNHPTGRGWYRTINDLIGRYSRNSPAQDNLPTNAMTLNSETGEETRTNPALTVEDANSSDDNATPSNNATRERVTRPLYRTNNVNLLHNEEASPSGTRNRLWNVPTVQVNDVPVSEQPHSPWHPRFVANRQRLNERLEELRSTGGLFRPRFLHPLYAGVNPFDADLDDPQREPVYDGDIIATVTPNHRIQVWEFSKGIIPIISNALKNIVVNECKIHNDASVDYASDGTILVTLLPSGGYMNITNRLGVYSLEWETLGQCLYVTSFEQNAVSVSLSPLNRHLVVGLASRRVSINPSEKWTMARIFLLDEREASYGRLSPIRELEQNRDTSYMSVNCIRWLPSSGQGLVFATNTGHLRFLT